MEVGDKIYLGDGVYLFDDGYHLILETDGNKIFLDDRVQTALVRAIEERRKPFVPDIDPDLGW